MSTPESVSAAPTPTVFPPRHLAAKVNGIPVAVNLGDDFRCIPLNEIDLAPGALGTPEGPPTNTPSFVEFIADLTASIAAQGQLEPALVRIKPDGRFQLIFGHKRLMAVAMLKQHVGIRTGLWSRVVTSQALDPDLDKWAAMAQDLLHASGRQIGAEYYRTIREWQDLYHARFPKSKEHSAGGKARAESSARDGGKFSISPTLPPPADEESSSAGLQVLQDKDTADGAGSPPDANESVAPFSKVLAESTGQTQRSAQIQIARARGFSDAEHRIFEGRGITGEQMDQIKAIQDQARRSRLISAIGVGDSFAEAYAQAIDPDDIPDSVMTDEQWLAKYCPNRATMASTEVFDADAIYWRDARDWRTGFKREVNKRLGGGKPLGPFKKQVIRLANVAHPKEWKVCGGPQGCKGSGKGIMGINGGKCPLCHGAGYHLAQDDGF